MRFTALALVAVSLILAPASARGGDIDQDTGDAAIAARYASWAITAAEEGRWPEAEMALERAADFSAASSDLSYLLALARLKLDRPAGAALSAVRRAIEADRWDRYGREAGLLVEAGILARLRRFDDAMDALASVPRGPERAYIQAVSLANDPIRFRSVLASALEAYPEDPRFARLLLDVSKGRLPGDGDHALVELVLARLPFLLGLDASLAYRASPFIRDLEERRRLVAAYRSSHHPDPASLPQALELGLVDETVATAELFSASSIDVVIFHAVWALLRKEAHREAFIAAAVNFAGTLTEDRDNDGYIETSARYRMGRLVASSYDADQDGLPEIELEYTDGVPVRGWVAASAGVSSDTEPEPAAILTAADERRLARVEWSRYPSVAYVAYDGTRYLPAPAAFPFAPVRLASLVEDRSTSVLRFPKDDPSVSRLTVRSLISFSSAVERRGTFTEGAVERVELVRGVPLRATEAVGGRVVSVLEFSNGRPSLRKADLDFDGRMETIRRLRTTTAPIALEWEEPIESVESDWDGDGKPEYGERHFEDGSVERSWDMDGDGVRERTERGRATSEDIHATQ